MRQCQASVRTGAWLRRTHDPLNGYYQHWPRPHAHVRRCLSTLIPTFPRQGALTYWEFHVWRVTISSGYVECIDIYIILVLGHNWLNTELQQNQERGRLAEWMVWGLSLGYHVISMQASELATNAKCQASSLTVIWVLCAVWPVRRQLPRKETLYP